MAKMRVNHRKLRDASNKLKEIIQRSDNQWTVMNNSFISVVDSIWKGTDAVTIRDRWTTIQGKGRMRDNVRSGIEKTANKLTQCADIYQKAQEDIYNKARKI